MYQLMLDLEKAGFKTKFFNWNGTAAGQFTEKNAPGAEAIVASIRDVYAKTKIEHLILVGHSWGGHTMLEVAKGLTVEPTIKIDVAIGLDPSSLLRGERMKQLPPNVGKFVNFHTHNAFTWGEWNDEVRVENIDLGDPSNGFMVDGKPNYGAVLDLNAHNAAEWDEHIQAEMTKCIRTTVIGLPSTNARGTKLPTSASTDTSH